MTQDTSKLWKTTYLQVVVTMFFRDYYGKFLEVVDTNHVVPPIFFIGLLSWLLTMFFPNFRPQNQEDDPNREAHVSDGLKPPTSIIIAYHLGVPKIGGAVPKIIQVMDEHDLVSKHMGLGYPYFRKPPFILHNQNSDLDLTFL